MIVRAAWLAGCGTYNVEPTNDVYNPTDGTVRFIASQPKNAEAADEKDEDVDPANEPSARPALARYLNIAALANLASVEQRAEEGSEKTVWKAEGAPTEVAIEVFVQRFGWNRNEMSQGPGAEWKHLAEFPFDSDVKKMTVIFKHVESGKTHVFTKVCFQSTLIALRQRRARVLTNRLPGRR